MVIRPSDNIESHLCSSLAFAYHSPLVRSLMSALNSQSSSVPVRTFGRLDSSVTESGNDAPPRETSAARRFLGRISFGNLNVGRPSFSSFRSRTDGDTLLPSPKSDRPAIPTMMQPSGEAYSTPLPKISMIVLSIVSKT